MKKDAQGIDFEVTEKIRTTFAKEDKLCEEPIIEVRRTMQKGDLQMLGQHQRSVDRSLQQYITDARALGFNWNSFVIHQYGTQGRNGGLLAPTARVAAGFDIPGEPADVMSRKTAEVMVSSAIVFDCLEQAKAIAERAVRVPPCIAIGELPRANIVLIKHLFCRQRLKSKPPLLPMLQTRTARQRPPGFRSRFK